MTSQLEGPALVRLRVALLCALLTSPSSNSSEVGAIHRRCLTHDQGGSGTQLGVMGTEGSEFFVLASLYLPDMPLHCWYYAVASNVLMPLLIGHMPSF